MCRGKGVIWMRRNTADAASEKMGKYLTACTEQPFAVVPCEGGNGGGGPGAQEVRNREGQALGCLWQRKHRDVRR